jgi:hypothetical protein
MMEKNYRQIMRCGRPGVIWTIWHLVSEFRYLLTRGEGVKRKGKSLRTSFVNGPYNYKPGIEDIRLMVFIYGGTPAVSGISSDNTYVISDISSGNTPAVCAGRTRHINLHHPTHDISPGDEV